MTNDKAVAALRDALIMIEKKYRNDSDMVKKAIRILSGVDNPIVPISKPSPRRHTVRHKVECKQCGRKFLPKRTGKMPMFCHRPCTSWKYNWEQGTTKKQQAADRKTLAEASAARKAKGETLLPGDPLRAAAPAGH